MPLLDYRQDQVTSRAIFSQNESLWAGSCNKSSRKLYEISSISLDWYLDLMRVEIEVGSKSYNTGLVKVAISRE